MNIVARWAGGVCMPDTENWQVTSYGWFKVGTTNFMLPTFSIISLMHDMQKSAYVGSSIKVIRHQHESKKIRA